MKILINGNEIAEILRSKFIHEDDIDLNTLDKIIGHLKCNKKQYIRLVYLVAIGFNLFGIPVFAGGYNDLTLEFFGYIKMACKAIMLIGLPVELIKCISGGTLDQIGRVSIKYIAFGLIIRFLPDIVSKILP